MGIAVGKIAARELRAGHQPSAPVSATSRGRLSCPQTSMAWTWTQ